MKVVVVLGTKKVVEPARHGISKQVVSSTRSTTAPAIEGLMITHSKQTGIILQNIVFRTIMSFLKIFHRSHVVKPFCSSSKWLTFC